MAFTTSVLLIPGEKYDTLTTSDSGWFYDVAAEIDQTNALAENNPLSHAPYGLPVSLSGQAQPLITVMLYRGVNALNPSVDLMDVVRYWGPLLFALSLIPIFLIGRELGGDLGGYAAAFFGATFASQTSWMSSPIYWMKVGAYDAEPIQLILGAWTMYLIIKLFKAPRSEIPKFALLAGLVYGLFGLSWAGALYIAPIMIGGLLFVLFAGFFGRLIRKTTDLFGAFFSAIRGHLSLILSVLGVLVVATLALWAVGGQSPMLWVGFAQSLLGYVGIGGGGISYGRYAGEMRPPESWGEVADSFYGAGILTTFVLILVILALIKFCWSRKRWELLVFPWFIVIALMVWPGKGQVRFERMWWPFVPALAGVGVAVLASLIRRLSFEQFGDWLKQLQRPIVVAFCVGIVTTPFILNSYATAAITTPPTGEWRDEGFMDVFAWIRENTPEDSVISIQWSYGHLLTGATGRATVTDGAGPTMGKLVERENKMVYVDEADNPLTVIPPDEVYWMEGNLAKYVGASDPQNRRSYRPYHIEGRRPDVWRLSVAGENEFRWIISTYRDNYNCKIDYVIFDYVEYYNATQSYQNSTMAALWYEDALKQMENVHTQNSNLVFNFGENRENVVLDQQTFSVYLTTDGDRLYFDGYAQFTVDDAGKFLDYQGFRPYPSPDIPETLVIFTTEGGNIVGAKLIPSASDLINAIEIPMSVRVFTGNLGGIDYLQIAYTSSNNLVKVVEVNLVLSLISPAEGTKTNDVTPTFQWSGAVGAAGYELWVDNDVGFASPEILENVLDTTYTSAAVLAEGTYSWQVRAFKADNTELGWSPAQTFVIDTTPPAVAALHAPENGITTSDNTPTFEWTLGTGAAKHRLLVDNDGGFPTPEVDVTLDAPENFHTSSELAAGSYWWKVIAIDDANNENESLAWEFTVQT